MVLKFDLCRVVLKVVEELNTTIIKLSVGRAIMEPLIQKFKRAIQNVNSPEAT